MGRRERRCKEARRVRRGEKKAGALVKRREEVTRGESKCGDVRTGVAR